LKSLPTIAKSHGASIFILNKESTPLDESADVVIHGNVGEVLPALLQKVKQMQARK